MAAMVDIVSSGWELLGEADAAAHRQKRAASVMSG
jgi:hypothetical protein